MGNGRVENISVCRLEINKKHVKITVWINNKGFRLLTNGSKLAATQT